MVVLLVSLANHQKRGAIKEEKKETPRTAHFCLAPVAAFLGALVDYIGWFAGSQNSLGTSRQPMSISCKEFRTPLDCTRQYKEAPWMVDHMIRAFGWTWTFGSFFFRCPPKWRLSSWFPRNTNQRWGSLRTNRRATHFFPSPRARTYLAEIFDVCIAECLPTRKTNVGPHFATCETCGLADNRSVFT